MIGQAEWMMDHFALLLGICVVGSLVIIGIYFVIDEIWFRVARRRNRNKNQTRR